MKRTIALLLVVCCIGILFVGCGNEKDVVKPNKVIEPTNIINDTPPDMIPEKDFANVKFDNETEDDETELTSEEMLKKMNEMRLRRLRNMCIRPMWQYRMHRLPRLGRINNNSETL